MTDYAALIDGPTWAFIRASEAAYPPDAATLTIAAQRAIYDTMCCSFFQGFSARDHRKGCARVRCALPDLSGPGPVVVSG